MVLKVKGEADEVSEKKKEAEELYWIFQYMYVLDVQVLFLLLQ